MDRYQAEQLVNSQLDPGEGVLWTGAPDPGRLALSSIPAMVFGVPFTGFAAFWISMAFSTTSGPSRPAGPLALFPLFGLPFLLIGLGMLTAPLWAYLAAGRTVYAVTNRRALILSRLLATTVKSYTHDEIHELQHVERAGGSGDLYFASRTVYMRHGRTSQVRVGFLGIPDVRGVEQLIRSRLQQNAA